MSLHDALPICPVVRSQVATFDAIATETGDPEQILRRLIGAAVAQTAADPYAARIIRNDTRHFGVMQGLDEVVRQQRTVPSRCTSAVRKGIDIGLFRSYADHAIVTMCIADVVARAYLYIRPLGRMPATPSAQHRPAPPPHGAEATC